MQMGGPTASLPQTLQGPQPQRRKWPTASATPTDQGWQTCRLWFNLLVVFAFFFLKRNSYLFIFGCAGSLSLPRLALGAASGGYSSLRGTGFSLGWLLLLWSVGSGVCWLQELWLLGLRAQAQSRWLTGLAAPQHVGSSWIRDGTYVFLLSQADSLPLAHQGSPSLPWLSYCLFAKSWTSCQSLECKH